MKVIAFDVFGTLFDLRSVPIPELQDYQRHLKEFRESGEWKPLRFPKSWEDLPSFEDTYRGLQGLRLSYFVCTCSNAPLGLQARMFKEESLTVDAFIPLELKKTYKTNPEAYLTVCDVLGVEPKDVLMVTANEHFGDLEASKALGMTPCLIRKYKATKTVIRLHQLLNELKHGSREDIEQGEELASIQEIRRWVEQQ